MEKSFLKKWRLKLPLPNGTLTILLFFSFFLLTACGPKQRVVIDRRESPVPRQEVKREVMKEEGREKPAYEARLPSETKLEKRETREVQYGMASWYGGEFHGRPTSSGEIYDMFQLTCAHNSLPLGTMVMVTNQENGRTVELKVNDRGPFLKDRIIDLSYAAARILGVWGKGTAFVKVEWIGSPLVKEAERFNLQIGSFNDENRARDLAEELKKNFGNVHLATVETQTQKYHRVRIGPFETREAALPVAEKLSQLGFNVLLTNR
jgi:rare lipoprotein A